MKVWKVELIMDDNKFISIRIVLAVLALYLFFIPALVHATTNSSIAALPLIFTHTQIAANTFVFNPKTLRWQAIKNGKVIKSGRASGGSNYCKDIKRACRTPAGTFRIISKRGANCKSSRYPVGKGGAPMPYCMFYSQYYGIHGSYDVPNRNASHGCIRVEPSAAKWLYYNFIKIGTKVVVKPY
jgi:lipoprotein-anchoring transpeptidase ErfK/SrfK